MRSSQQPGPIRIDLDYSFWLASYLLLIHLLATILVLMLDLGIYFSLALIALVALSLIMHWRRDVQRKQSNSVIGVDWSHDKEWLVRFKNGNSLKTELSPTSLVSRWLIVLHFKTDGSVRHRVAIANDAVEYDQLRKLKVLLKMYDHFGV